MAFLFDFFRDDEIEKLIIIAKDLDKRWDTLRFDFLQFLLTQLLLLILESREQLHQVIDEVAYCLDQAFEVGLAV